MKSMGIRVCIGFIPPGITKVIGKVPADCKVACSGPAAHVVVWLLFIKKTEIYETQSQGKTKISLG